MTKLRKFDENVLRHILTLNDTELCKKTKTVVHCFIAIYSLINNLRSKNTLPGFAACGGLVRQPEICGTGTTEY